MKRLKKGAVIAGKYRLRRRLASGGMGSVWRGHHLTLDIPIAIKFIDPDLLARGEERWKQRFELEAKSAAKLRHPQVVQVFDHGIEEGVPFIVMELLEGEDLGRHLARMGPMALEDVALLTMEVARPLGRAHDAGIVHRDLKPSNIFLVRAGDETLVKILDFGIAKTTVSAPAGESTRSTDLLGSPTYMSPEQAVGARDVDHRADLWALSVIVYRALTGAVPFQGTLGRVIVDVCTRPPRAPSEIVPGLSGAVDVFFERAFAQDPAERFQSARELAAELSAIAGVHMPRPSLPIREQHHDGPVPSDKTPATGIRGSSTTLAATLTESPVPRRRRSSLWWTLAAAAVALGTAALVSRAALEGELPHSEPIAPLPAPLAEQAHEGASPTDQAGEPDETPRAEASSQPPDQASAAPPPSSARAVPRAPRTRQPPRPAPSSSATSGRPISEFGY